MRALLRFALLASFALFLTPARVRADVTDDVVALQSQIEEVLLDALGDRTDAHDWTALQTTERTFANDLRSPQAKSFWANATASLHANAAPDSNLLPGESASWKMAQLTGAWQAALQHVLAFEMLGALHDGRVAEAQEWRALIAVPKHANSVEGALALQRLGANRSQQEAVGELLGREYLTWQSARVREKLDALKRVVAAGHASANLVSARIGEITTLAQLPLSAKGAAMSLSLPAESNEGTASTLLTAAAKNDWPAFLETFGSWRTSVEASLPNLLTPQEVERRGRLLVKLVKLVPKEYHNGVRDGQVVVPLEYREAKDFIVQAQQLVNELSGVWRQSNAAAFEKNGAPLLEKLEATEKLILAKADPQEVESGAKAIAKTLESDFGLSAQRSGSGLNLVDEVALDVRAALRNSLAAAQAGRWAEAESLRVDAYTTFDTEMEKRILPRDPELGLRTERSFLDGQADQPGIKALADQRKKGPALEAAYRRTLTAVDQCKALLKVNLSPATVVFTVLTIAAREGLEAVVVLAALLAGMRGAENRVTRRNVVTGAWLALGATALTFWVSRTLIQSLSRFGEKLEAVVSVLAVLVLLIVTNWVFHKVYWVGWNAKLRKLSKSADAAEEGVESYALIMVGFLTIYREGFETTLFLQSLILESGMKWVLVGIALGGLMVAVVGVAIFVIGARLPYRKLLVFTGVLVVTILVTFLGSTVRLFQTVGWLTIHPIPSLHLPTWAGFWLGLYPSLEGLLIPMLGFAYVGAAWLFVKWQSYRRGAKAMREARESDSFRAHPALAKRS